MKKVFFGIFGIIKEFLTGEPRWFHPYGGKVLVVGVNQEYYSPRKELILGPLSNLVSIRICKHPSKSNYLISYEISHPKEPSTDKGRIEMSDVDLRRAFGLSEDLDSEHKVPGKFIRSGDYLHIISGSSQDPGVFIHLDNKIKKDVEMLL